MEGRSARHLSDSPRLGDAQTSRTIRRLRVEPQPPRQPISSDIRRKGRADRPCPDRDGLLASPGRGTVRVVVAPSFFDPRERDGTGRSPPTMTARRHLGQEGAHPGAPRAGWASRPGGTATTTSSPTASPRSSPAGSTGGPGRSPGRCVGSSATITDQDHRRPRPPPRARIAQAGAGARPGTGGEVGPRPDRRPPGDRRQGGDLRPARGRRRRSSPTRKISPSTSIATTGSTGRRWPRWPTG